MRLQIISLLIFLTCLQVSAKTYSQRITVNIKEATLEKAFAEIEQKSGYIFWFRTKELNPSTKVSLHFTDAGLKEVLDQLFKNQPLVYEIVDQTIIVKRKDRALAPEATLLQKNIDLSGKIRDEKGNPLPGASVQVKGSLKTAIADENGDFTLKDVGEDAILVVNFVGHKTREIPVPTPPTKIQISLESSSTELDKVQILAYGSTTKRLATGNTVSIGADEIQKQPINNPILALQGRVPGMTIVQSNGIAGSKITVRVQGINSIGSGLNPLYVVDGVPYPSDNLPSLSTILDGGSPLSFINPSTIESIEVLKDADATSIYGSRAANGAILITTKKGKTGQTSVDFNIQNGWAKISRRQKLLNTQQYLEIRKEAYFTNDGLTTSSPAYATAYDINGTWDTTRYTDWQKELIGGTAHFDDYQLNISGGSGTTTFLFGTNYHRETTVYPGDLSDKKVSFQMSLNHRSKNGKLRFQLSQNYLNDNNLLGSYDLASKAVQLAPNAPALYNDDGSLNWAPRADGVSTWANPLNYLLRSYTNKTNNLISNSFIGYQLIPGLEIKSNFGYTKLESEENIKVPIIYYAPQQRATNTRTAINSKKAITTWIIEPQISYKKKIHLTNIEVLAGSTLQKTLSNLNEYTYSGFVTDEQISNLLTAPTVRLTNFIETDYRYKSIFGRTNVNVKDKYLINFNIRRDGTSRFGAQNLFHTFYSIAGGWIFSEEKAIKDKFKFLSFGKIRGSYGSTGSDQIKDYAYLNLYNTTTVGVPYGGATGLSPAGHSNPYIQWESTQKANIGLDLGLLENSLLLNVNYYRNISSNQLVTTPLSIVTGFNAINTNLPAKISNTGFELMLSYQGYKSRKITWSSNINLTISRNKLLAFPGLESNVSYSNFLVIGQPIGITKIYQYAGIDPATGLYQFKKNDGTLTSAPSTKDKIATVSTLPSYFGGFQNTFSYKNFSLDILIQFTKQTGRTDYIYGNLPGSVGYNQPTTILNRFRKDNQQTDIQTVSTSTGAPLNSFFAVNSSTAAYNDASYIKFRNASLSWKLPEKWQKALHMQSARVYTQGQNLFTITHSLQDPESQSVIALPTLRTITVGIQTTF